ncbi:hypothetical protein CBR_g10802 [Chara braunii]|uniref:RING-type E3 ubiquitin transferase n=1 Tax=Chara braunii TaxID=69332 RepID=A0A388KPA3_CHABU|nr:hypothetical protein CBR_g10802 [Chara braunii]|eukprot:GBG71865.1 hypothetical protein CBR_g10802 [Chara braunii]
MEKADMAETGEKAEKSGKGEDTETSRSGSAHLTSAAAFVEAGVQDPCEDACSICLEAFSDDEPGTITNCNHEYHLQCILEWAQRSKECPLCWQPLSLKDPSSQELLLAVESERALARGRVQAPSVFPRAFDIEYPFPGGYADDADLERRIMHHLAAAAAGMSRARFVASRREILRGNGTPSNTHSGLSSGNTSSSSSISSNGSGGGGSSNNSQPSSLVVGASGAFGSMSEGVSRVFGLASGSSHSPAGSNSAGSSPNQTIHAPVTGTARPNLRSGTDVGNSVNATAAAGGGAGGGGLLSVGSSLVDVFPRLRSAAEQQGQTANGNQQSNGHPHHHHQSHHRNHHSHRTIDTNEDRRPQNHNHHHSQRHQQQVLQTQLQQQTQPRQTSPPPQSSSSQWDFHEFSSFSEAFKSKWAAASSRCRDLTKMTRGFREKLRVRNGAMSDLGVRAREMGVNMVRALERMGADEGQRSAGSSGEGAASSSGSSGTSARTRGALSSSSNNGRLSFEAVTTNAARRVVPTLTVCGNDEVVCRAVPVVGEVPGVGSGGRASSSSIPGGSGSSGTGASSSGAGASSSSSSLPTAAVAAAAAVPGTTHNAFSEREERTPDPLVDSDSGGIVSHETPESNNQVHRGECAGTSAIVSCDTESNASMPSTRNVSADGDGDMTGDSKTGKRPSTQAFMSGFCFCCGCC